MLKLSYGSSEGFEIEHEGKAYKVKLPDACKYDQKWLITKFRFVTDMRDVLGAETISFVEEYVKPEKKEEPAKAEPERKEEREKKEEGAPEKKPKKAKEAPKEAAQPKPERAPEELSPEDR